MDPSKANSWRHNATHSSKTAHRRRQCAIESLLSGVGIGQSMFGQDRHHLQSQTLDLRHKWVTMICTTSRMNTLMRSMGLHYTIPLHTNQLAVEIQCRPLVPCPTQLRPTSSQTMIQSCWAGLSSLMHMRQVNLFANNMILVCPSLSHP